MKLEDLTNRIVSASASLIAIAALVTAVYQAKLSRDQAKATVWPYLIQGNSGNNGYSRIVQNVGVGPAIIRGFEVYVDNKPVTTWSVAAKAMGVQLSWKGHRTTTFRPGIVVPAGGVIDLLDLPDSSDAKLFRTRVELLRTWICFCSIYGDCWTSTSGEDEPKQTKVCKDDPRRRFNE